MKRFLIGSFAALGLLCTAACTKTGTPKPAAVTEAQVLNDFANSLANPNYNDLNNQAILLQSAVQNLAAAPNDASLQAAQQAWRNTRAPWEQCEGFLFGPVEDYNYDPSIDTWPLDRVSLDSLLASPNPLNLSDVDSLPYSLKGFHAIEYVLFGTGGTRKASDLTARQFKYLTSLTASLVSTTASLKNSWAPAAGNFTAEVVNAGAGSKRYSTRKDAFIAIVSSMIDICNEVANEKMQTPLQARDSMLDESSFSHNSVSDFRNNVTGIQNVWLCRYSGAAGHSLSELVSAKNLSLANTISSQLTAAISSFSTITATYEKAIYEQRVQVQQTQDAVNTLKTTLEDQLMPFIVQNIKD